MKIAYKKIPVIIDENDVVYDSPQNLLIEKLQSIFIDELHLSNYSDVDDVIAVLADKRNRSILKKINDLIDLTNRVELELQNAKVEIERCFE